MDRGIASLAVALVVAAIMYFSNGNSSAVAGFVGFFGFLFVWA